MHSEASRDEIWINGPSERRPLVVSIHVPPTSAVEEDIAGVRLPAYQRGLRRYTRRQWEHISYAGHSFGRAGQELHQAIVRRRDACANELDAAGHHAGAAVCRDIILAKAEAHAAGCLLVRMRDVCSSALPDLTREAAVEAVNLSWVRARHEVEMTAAAVYQPDMYVPESGHLVIDRLADLAFGRAFIPRILSRVHACDISMSGLDLMTICRERTPLATLRDLVNRHIESDIAHEIDLGDHRRTVAIQVAYALSGAPRFPENSGSITRRLNASQTLSDLGVTISRDRRWGTYSISTSRTQWSGCDLHAALRACLSEANRPPGTSWLDPIPAVDGDLQQACASITNRR